MSFCAKFVVARSFEEEEFQYVIVAVYFEDLEFVSMKCGFMKIGFMRIDTDDPRARFNTEGGG